MKERVNEKVKGFASQFGGMASMLGSYIESHIKDKEKLDQQIKFWLQMAEGVVKESAKQYIVENLSKINFPNKNDKVVLKIKKLDHFKGILPSYQSELASGFDVRAQIIENIKLSPGERTLIPTGLSFEIPPGFEIQARPRSGWAIKEGISLVNSPGTIDADYRGEVKIIVINLGQEPVEIEDQDRIAQLVVAPVVLAEFELSEDLSGTERGDGGFGSTGAN